jgi:hypothetical protein
LDPHTLCGSVTSAYKAGPITILAASVGCPPRPDPPALRKLKRIGLLELLPRNAGRLALQGRSSYHLRRVLFSSRFEV